MALKFEKKYLNVLIHVLIWVGVIFIPKIFIRWPQKDFYQLREVVTWSTMIAAFYLNYYVFIPAFLNKKKVFLYIVVLTITLSGAFLGNFAIQSTANLQRDVQEMKVPRSDEELMEMQKGMHRGKAIGSTFLCFLILALGTSIRVTGQWYSNEEKRKEAENQKLTTELSFLKSQINPHFFFNTLNSIYSLAYKKSDQTPEAIIKLSQLMRYVIYESDKEKVPLEKELEYVGNFVELQKLRLKDNVDVRYLVEGNYKDKAIAPLILLPFIENAFKHGVDYTRDCVILIRVVVTSDTARLIVENPIVEQAPVSEIGEGGFGLVNARKRLELIYPEEHTLSVLKENGNFHVELNIQF